MEKVGPAVCKADVAVVALNNGYPTYPVLLSDMKLDKMEMAVRATTVYSMKAMMGNDIDDWTVHLGLAFTKENA